MSLATSAPDSTTLPASVVNDRNFRGLLNKITRNPESFTPLSAQVVGLVNESEGDTQRLRSFVQQVYEHAVDCATFCGLFARLCQTLTEGISPEFSDDSFDSEGALKGGQLFCKYLLDHCQAQLDCLWNTLEDANPVLNKNPGPQNQESFSEEYYATEKNKRERRGLVQFVAELYKLDVLTEQVVHDFATRFLEDSSPGEQKIEGLCILLSVAGESLDKKASPHINAYFERMEKLAVADQIPFRLKMMLTDVIELRQRNWVSRNVFAVNAVESA